MRDEAAVEVEGHVGGGQEGGGGADVVQEAGESDGGGGEAGEGGELLGEDDCGCGDCQRLGALLALKKRSDRAGDLQR